MIAISDKVQERSLEFSTKSLISFSSPWSFEEGSGTIGSSSIDLNSGAICECELTNVKKKVTYFKLVCRVTTADTSLNTAYVHKVAVMLKVHYTKNEIPDTVELFYPNFDFEDDYADYTIIEMSGDKISSIEVKIMNSEDASITVNQVGLYYITQVTEENLNESLDNAYKEDPTTVSDIINNAMENGYITKLVIPLYEDYPTNPVDGEIFRLPIEARD